MSREDGKRNPNRNSLHSTSSAFTLASAADLEQDEQDFYPNKPAAPTLRFGSLRRGSIATSDAFFSFTAMSDDDDARSTCSSSWSWSSSELASACELDSFDQELLSYGPAVTPPAAVARAVTEENSDVKYFSQFCPINQKGYIQDIDQNEWKEINSAYPDIGVHSPPIGQFQVKPFDNNPHGYHYIKSHDGQIQCRAKGESANDSDTFFQAIIATIVSTQPERNHFTLNCRKMKGEAVASLEQALKEADPLAAITALLNGHSRQLAHAVSSKLNAQLQDPRFSLHCNINGNQYQITAPLANCPRARSSFAMAAG